MGKLKDWFRRPIKRSTFSLTMAVMFLLTFYYMTYRANDCLSIGELHCGVVNKDLCVTQDDGNVQRVLLHKVYGYVNSKTPPCEGDTVTLVSFRGGLDSDFRCYLGQPNEELMSLMMQNALTEVYRLFLYVGGFYILIFVVMYVISLVEERNCNKITIVN